MGLLSAPAQGLQAAAVPIISWQGHWLPLTQPTCLPTRPEATSPNCTSWPLASLGLVSAVRFGPDSAFCREARGGAGGPLTPALALKVFSGHSLADGPRLGGEPPVTFLRTEEGPDPAFPRTIPLIQQLLNTTEVTQDPAAYSQLVAVMVYTAERAKFATGVERQDWMQLFIDTFKLVHRDITGDPETALALC